ncbi:iron(II)-dependent oxidoreductase [Actinoalloteichus hoggarensis]|uniref:Iron(II)-dependent oxidoreductase EgtB n=1 Tax=Actinoalloteichus hoggarensis TaxID=1470176 RepID=A0A221W743_9PSEU|nr:SUMF1/EgtB/PvdO family nonheme iron enzyme [Actinoalloteichus hoggarensis]ASO21574.1 Iron(II)-dependent oxidoreductase EgtB [Actinoalloteichus hoggarensis]MBB5922166.1 iron(II)-dependent oxidoreductase [Actinoalloteichus hoggarensis]
MDLEWITVRGGVSRFGDRARRVRIPTLRWTRTPITYAQLDRIPPCGSRHHPVTDLDHDDAVAVAATLGGRLPRSAEWEWMAAGAERRQWPWGDQPWNPTLANLRDAGHAYTVPVDAHSDGATPEGILDVAGNVWEWTATPTMGAGAVIRGGSYASSPLYARCTFLNAAPTDLRSPGIGLRVVIAP